MPCCFISAPDAINNGLVSFDWRRPFSWPRSAVDHDQLAHLLVLIGGKAAMVLNCVRALFEGEDPSDLLDGVRARLVTHCLSLSEPSRELGSNPFGHGLSPHRRSISCSTCVAFLPSACLCSLLCLSFSLPLPRSLLFVSASTSIGVSSFPSAMLHCYAWCIAFHSIRRASYPCSLVAFSPTCLRHSESF